MAQFWPDGSMMWTTKGCHGDLYALMVRRTFVNLEHAPGVANAEKRSSSAPLQKRWKKPWDQPSMWLEHQARRCKPCFFFHTKADGCRKGGQCDRCHFCSAREVKAFKLRLQRARSRNFGT
ncbi:unnamed protein product [Effrenium voratum]|nr:unnamed protein product [Effrenium voratum]